MEEDGALAWESRDLCSSPATDDLGIDTLRVRFFICKTRRLNSLTPKDQLLTPNGFMIWQTWEWENPGFHNEGK